MFKTATMNFKMSPHLYEAIKEQAAKREMSMAAFVRAAMAHFVFGAQDKDGLVSIDPDQSFIFDMGGDTLKNGSLNLGDYKLTPEQIKKYEKE
jgi:hypothetical protein